VIIFSVHNNKACLEISDNGKGLPEEVSEGRQAGLGLVLIRMLASQLGGTYKISNREGTVNTVEFSL
jgi:two-component sensor histidine kinase